MCEHVSWLYKGKKLLFLKDDEINTEKGQALLAHVVKENIIGHSACAEYFGVCQDDYEKGECTDFSSPKNFPPEIVEAIKQGKMRHAIFPPWLEALTKAAYADYWAKLKPLNDDYNAKSKALYDDYNAKRKALFNAIWANPSNRKPEWR